jgi:hypothetical protein
MQQFSLSLVILNGRHCCIRLREQIHVLEKVIVRHVHLLSQQEDCMLHASLGYQDPVSKKKERNKNRSSEFSKECVLSLPTAWLMDTHSPKFRRDTSSRRNGLVI